MRVEFYKLVKGVYQKVGTLSLSGDQIVLDPPDSVLLRNILTERHSDVSAEDWLKSLPKQYRSFYLRAKIIGSSERSSPRNGPKSRLGK